MIVKATGKLREVDTLYKRIESFAADKRRREEDAAAAARRAAP